MKKLLLVFAIASLANNINAIDQPYQPAQVNITNSTQDAIYLINLRCEIQPNESKQFNKEYLSPPGLYIQRNNVICQCEIPKSQDKSPMLILTVTYNEQDKKLAVNGKTCTTANQHPQTHPQTSITNETGYNLYMWGLDIDLGHNNTVNFNQKTTALQIRPKTEGGFVKCSDTNLKNLVKQNKKNEITYDATLNKLKINGNVCAG